MCPSGNRVGVDNRGLWTCRCLTDGSAFRPPSGGQLTHRARAEAGSDYVSCTHLLLIHGVGRSPQ